MRIRPAPGEPFQMVEVDREDLDPAKDTYGVSKETYAKYRQIAAAQAKAKARELKRIPSFSRDTELRIPGSRSTFASPPAATEEFLAHNPSLWDTGWADVGDGVEDWMDGIDVKQRHGHKALDETPRGRELLEMFRQGQNDRGLRETLNFIFGQARGRRWDSVSWSQIDDLVDIFAESARREADRTGSSKFLVAGVPRIEWMPPATGFAEPTPAFVSSLDNRALEYYRRWRASQDLYGLAARLEQMMRKNRKCLRPEERKAVNSRIKTIRAWAERPDTMPEWACASFREPAVICDLLGIEAELRKLAAACEMGYDPAWALHERDGQEWQPGLGVLPEAGEARGAPASDLDLPWETAANPRGRRKRRR
ncbi:MAG: hypothetical protein Q8Q14_07285 [Gemmatimonadales bacterium]|nr:hypothetical protein [Gemmatimonadales bacterium]